MSSIDPGTGGSFPPALKCALSTTGASGEVKPKTCSTTNYIYVRQVLLRRGGGSSDGGGGAGLLVPAAMYVFSAGERVGMRGRGGVVVVAEDNQSRHNRHTQKLLLKRKTRKREWCYHYYGAQGWLSGEPANQDVFSQKMQKIS